MILNAYSLLLNNPRPTHKDIQSTTVEEIAISIAAQLVLVRSQIQEKRKEIE